MARPQPRTPEQEFLAAVCDLLDRQAVLLGDIRDRLPARVAEQPVTDSGDLQTGPPAVVELREPDPPAAPKPAARKPAARKPAASKSTGAGSRTAKGQN